MALSGAVLATAIVVPSAAPASADVSPVQTVIVEGRGNGHGVGLSQWGAFGWSTLYGWSWDQILGHYYGGTTLSTLNAADYVGVVPGRMTVRLQALDGRQTAVVSDIGQAFTSADPLGVPWGSIVAREVPGQPNVYSVWGRIDQACPGGPEVDGLAAGWALINPAAPGPIAFATVNGDLPMAAVPSDLVGVCDATGAVRYYRGFIYALNAGDGSDRTINDVRLEEYVRGVVPRESPASWGDAGGGAGMNALRAQAVAARSYAMSGAPRAPYARTCDTTSCQVYGGSALRAAGPFTEVRLLEDPRTSRAVDETAGVVLRTASGAVALAMFSASNGGRTVSGGMFTPVDDPADAVAGNPFHTWNTSISAATIQSVWAIGRLLDITVTQRSGGGPWGGWVDQIVIRGTAASVTVSGDDFKRAFGLRSRYLNFGFIREPVVEVERFGPALFIGDSVGFNAASKLKAFIGDGYRMLYDHGAGRCIYYRWCLGTEGLTVAQRINTANAFAVVELGYNDTPKRMALGVDALMSTLVSKGITRVVWINMSERRLDKSGRPVFAAHNTILAAAMARWPQLTVLDWNAASSGPQATSWFVKGTKRRPDFVHLTAAGSTQFARFVRESLDALRLQGVLPNIADPTVPPPPDPNTPTVMRPVLKLGDRGSAVQELQAKLRSLRYAVKVDGIFGASTESAVKSIQRYIGHFADGVVTRATWQVLGFF
jgi:SpoIID/LytB domain protein